MLRQVQFADVADRKDIGIASLRKVHISTLDAMYANMQQRFRGYPQEARIEAGDYHTLHINNQIFMSDTPMECITNRSVIENAHGKVLIAGLGIGLLLENLRDKVEFGVVESIHVVEKCEDVVELISPYYDDLPLTIDVADIFKREIPAGEKWDTIYFDIWPAVSAENLPEMKILRERYKKHRNKGCWMGCWQERRCQSMKRASDKEDEFWNSVRKLRVPQQ